jgi:glycosyltransferase involved in cell wall biosynthesis
MRILQLTGDWKWTGPAEPMLLLLGALRERGHRVELACAEPPGAGRSGLVERACAAGAAPLLRLPPGRGGLRPFSDAGSARRLAALLAEHDFQVVHTWHTRDHVLALRAARRRRRSGRTVVVRSWAGAEAIPARPWDRWLFGPGCDGLLCVSPASARRNQDLRRGRPVFGALGAADVVRFGAEPPPGVREATRARFGIAADEVAIGIAARVQRHRRFDLLFSAFHALVRDRRRARLVVMGQGTHFDELARRPVEALGLGERVILAGQRSCDYVQALQALDLFSYLVPGSDGSCRALLEAALCGLPAVATRRGALPEIVSQGETGLLVEEEPGALAGAWRRLLDDPEERRRLGAAARRRALRLFAPGRWAADVEGFYERVREARASRLSPSGFSAERETSSR